MITNEYSPELVVTDKLVIPKRDYHKLYVKRSRLKHVLFALFIVVVLIATGVFLNT